MRKKWNDCYNCITRLNHFFIRLVFILFSTLCCQQHLYTISWFLETILHQMNISNLIIHIVKCIRLISIVFFYLSRRLPSLMYSIEQWSLVASLGYQLEMPDSNLRTAAAALAFWMYCWATDSYQLCWRMDVPQNFWTV